MQARTILIAPLVVSSLLVATPARAQRAPDMATLDRGDGITKLAFDVGYLDLDDAPYSGALRFELHGQYVTPHGLGFYGSIPFSDSFGDGPDPPGDQDDVALGGIELGMLFILDSPSVSWVFRGGVVTPTADDTRDGALTNEESIWPRLTDMARAVPDAWYLRPGLSLLYHANRLSLRADFGFDFALRATDAHFARVNVAGGIDLGVVALSLELVNLAQIDDVDDNEELFHTLTFAIRFMTRSFEPFIAVGSPLDDSVRGYVNFYLAGGLQFPF